MSVGTRVANHGELTSGKVARHHQGTLGLGGGPSIALSSVSITALVFSRIEWGSIMRGLGDFQRGQIRQGDPRIREAFSRVRQLLDLFEDIANHPYRPPEPEIKPERPTRTSEPPAMSAQSEIAPGPAPLLVSIKEARRLIGIGNTGIYKLINTGRVETVTIGKRRMVRYASLEQLAEISLPTSKTTAGL